MKIETHKAIFSLLIPVLHIMYQTLTKGMEDKVVTKLTHLNIRYLPK